MGTSRDACGDGSDEAVSGGDELSEHSGADSELDCTSPTSCAEGACICCEGTGCIPIYGICPLCGASKALDWISEEDRAKRGADLHRAAQSGATDRVVDLLSTRADVEFRDGAGRRALHRAAQFGHASVVLLLLDRGAQVEAEDFYRRTALHKAAGSGQVSAVRTLLTRRAEPDAQDESRQTPLHLAAAGGHADAVKALLEGGADPNLPGCHQRTPLHVAERCWRVRASVVDSLVAGGADCGARDAYRRTPLEDVPERVVTFHTSDREADGSLLVSCRGIAGNELASLRTDPEREQLSVLRERLAQHLALPKMKMKTIMPSGRLFTESDDSASLADLLGACA
mmetsp:Transcript_30561/g.66650  ORF Transcript_30561/g.66650 Transcript_30561/m.66650 type:complete len:342 (+) Transcript_30561:142-1167(+)